MPAPVTWKPFELVNTSIDSNQYNRNVTALEGGGYVVSWSGFPDPGNPVNKGFFQIYDAAGEKIGGETLFDTPHGAYSQVTIALPGGGFALIYNSLDSVVGSSWGIFTQHFDADGIAVGSPVQVHSEDDPLAPEQQTLPTVTTLSNGGYVVAYLCDEDDGARSIRFQMFDSSGAKIGTEYLVGSDPDATLNSLLVTDLGEGRFVVTWAAGTSSDSDIVMQIFRGSGSSQTAIIPITGTGAQTDPAVTAADDGRFLVTYYSSVDQELHGQLFAADGTLVKAEFQISDPAQNAPGTHHPMAVALNGGGYLVVWREVDNVFHRLVSQVLDADGNKVGAETILYASDDAGDNFYASALTLLADGRVVVTVTGHFATGDDTSGSSVHQFIVDLRDGMIDGTEGSDEIYGSVGVVDDVIAAKAGDDEVYGLAGDDTINGGEGNDTIDGGLGADSMIGGNGDDHYAVNDVGDAVVEGMDGGTDTVIANLDFTLSGGTEVENLKLENGDDWDLTGNEFGQRLVGNNGNNKLMGMGGNDTLDGGANVDYLAGGEGDDYYIVDSINELVVEEANQGNDTIEVEGFSYSLELRDNVENLILKGTGDLVGTGNALHNKLTGNDGGNHLIGLAGNDTLDGGVGADTMEGGEGDDTYVVDNILDQFIEAAGKGNDTIRTVFDHTLGADFENLVLLEGASTGTGNGSRNRLTGNDAANTLKGGAGKDTLDGGDGADRLEGGSSSDTYLLGSGSDVVVDSSGANDLIVSTKSRSLKSYSGIENLKLDGTGNINGTGNSASNDITGNSGNNSLKGDKGNDKLIGGLGVDLLWGGSGKDVFDFNSVAEIGKGTGTRDIIKDFNDSTDRIDLSTIDASTKSGGNNAFKFVSSEGAKFKGIAGQLIWDQKNYAGTSKDVTLVHGDINGDKIADFTLELTGLVWLSKGDFVL